MVRVKKSVSLTMEKLILLIILIISLILIVLFVLNGSKIVSKSSNPIINSSQEKLSEKIEDVKNLTNK